MIRTIENFVTKSN